MLELTQEQYDALPDYAKAGFVQDGDKHVPVKDSKLKATLDDVDGKFKATTKELEELREKLTAHEKQQQDAIEKARLDALEEARTKGDVNAVEERYKQQMADLEKRVAEKTRNETLAEVNQERAQEKAAAKVGQIATILAVDEPSRSVLQVYLNGRVSYDMDTKQYIFNDASGCATSLDEQGYIAELKKDPALQRLIKAEVTTQGGGGANGSANGSATAKNPFKKGEHFNLTEQARILKQDPEQARHLKQLAEG